MCHCCISWNTDFVLGMYPCWTMFSKVFWWWAWWNILRDLVVDGQKNLVRQLETPPPRPRGCKGLSEQLWNRFSFWTFGSLSVTGPKPASSVEKTNLRIFCTICGDHGGRVEVPGGKGGPPDDKGHLNCPYSDHHDLHVDQPELECPTGRTLLGTELTYSPSQDIWGMDVEKTRILEETNPEETLEIQVINLEMMSQWTNRTHQKRNFNCVIKHWQKDLQ